MLTGLAVIAMLTLGTLLWFRKMAKISEMLERTLDEHSDEALTGQLHARLTTRADAHD
jgi:hypothetical protein